MLGLSCRIKSQDLGGASGPGLGSAYASPAQGHFLSAIIFTVLHFRVCGRLRTRSIPQFGNVPLRSDCKIESPHTLCP